MLAYFDFSLFFSFVYTLSKCKQFDKFSLKQLTQCFLRSFILSLAYYHLNDKNVFHVTLILKQTLSYWMTVYSSHLYKNMHLGFSCLFFLLNLICDISSLSVSITLNNNLLTEFGIDRLEIYYKTLQCLIKSFTGVSTWCNACKCCSLARRNWDI